MRNSKYITVRYLRAMIINDLSLMKLYLHVYLRVQVDFVYGKNLIAFFSYFFIIRAENGTLSKRVN